MASTLIGSLRVALGLDTAQFEAGANKSRSIARGMSKDIESSFKSAKIAVEGLVAAFAVGALTEQIKKSLQYAAAIGETAVTLGVTAKQLQEYRFAAQQSGVAQEALEGGLQRLTVSIGKSKLGSEAQTKAFEALAKAGHTTVEELRSGNTGDVFAKIADALKNVTDRSQRAAVEVALFGRAGAQLDSLLSGGSARLNALSEAARQLGIVLSDEQIRNAEQTAHKLEALQTVLQANIASAVTANANSILSLAQALSTLTTEVLNFLNSHPQLALGIIGGLAGSRFGTIGAAIGAAGGALAGEKLAENQSDAKMDYAYRFQQLRLAEQGVARLKGQSQSGDTSILGGIITLHRGTVGSAGDLKAAQAELAKQHALFAQAGMAALQPEQGPVPPGANLPKFLAGNKRGRKPPADRSDELLAQLDKEILQSSQQILQAKLGLAGSNEEHLQISVQLVELEKTIREKAIDEELAKAQREHAEHKITDAALREAEHKAAILKAAAETEAAVKLRALVEQQLARADQANFARADQQFRFQQEALKVADQLATTQADHRRIQLQILDSEIAQRRYELEHEKQLAIRNGATADEIKVIQDQIDHLSTDRAQGAATIEHNTQSPLESYFSNLPHTAAEVNQALQSIEVEGIQGLSGALAKAGQGWGAMRDAAISALQDIASKLIELGIQRAIFSLFGGIVGAAGGGGGGGGVVDLTHGEIGAFPGLADGGSFRVGGHSGVDRNVLSINGRPRVRVSSDETVAVIPRHGFYGLPGMASGGLLSVLSPLAFLATKAGFGSAALPHLNSGGKMNGDTFHIHVTAPNTGNASRDRRTSLQQAADIRHAVAGAAAKGLA